MVKNENKHTHTKSLIKSSFDILLVIVISICVAFAFDILSVYNKFVSDNNVLCFAIVELIAFGCIMMYKRWKK